MNKAQLKERETRCLKDHEGQKRRVIPDVEGKKTAMLCETCLAYVKMSQKFDAAEASLIANGTTSDNLTAKMYWKCEIKLTQADILAIAESYAEYPPERRENTSMDELIHSMVEEVARTTFYTRVINKWNPDGLTRVENPPLIQDVFSSFKSQIVIEETKDHISLYECERAFTVHLIY